MGETGYGEDDNDDGANDADNDADSDDDDLRTTTNPNALQGVSWKT